MLELTAWGDLLRALGTIYWLIAFGALGLAIYKTRGKHGRARWLPIGLVLLVFFALPVSHFTVRLSEGYQRKARLDKAMARFEELCKSSGEFIHRTGDGVDGIFLMKLRPTKNRIGAIDAVDPYGYEGDGNGGPFGNESYLHGFLEAQNESGMLLNSIEGTSPGYHYVDLVSPEDEQRYRYSARQFIPPEYQLTRSSKLVLDHRPVTPTAAFPRYGVTYDDITLPEDRQMWIAGSSLRVVDLDTGEILGERIGYAIDKGQGSRATARIPWIYAITTKGWSCPQISQFRHASYFVKKVIKPSELFND